MGGVKKSRVWVVTHRIIYTLSLTSKSYSLLVLLQLKLLLNHVATFIPIKLE